MFKQSPWMLASLAPYLDMMVHRRPRPATPPQATASPAALAALPAKVYVEITTCCNLACRTCVRNAWDETLGHMTMEIYARLIDGVAALPRPVTMVFAGYGEPTCHPQFLDMLKLAKEAGARVEIVTNGMALDAAMAQALIELAIDKVWFSIDGLTPARYAAIRRGGELDVLSSHIHQLYGARRLAWRDLPEIGLAFVAMKSNVGELPGLHWLASAVHASDVMVSNLLPHTPDMVDEILYANSLAMGRYSRSAEVPRVHLPRLDFSGAAREPLLALLNSAWSLSLSGADLAGYTNYCPFVQAGAVSVRRDGEVSPCPPLLHTHPVYVDTRWRRIRHAGYGNIGAQSLAEIWAGEAYSALRSRVAAFQFAPCATCGGCELTEANEADCCGNTFPTCGGCLWAQGIVRCP